MSRPARRYGAVGGVVVDERSRVLLLEREVLRDGAWVREVRLPKGPLQPREADAETALLEVSRLTGYQDLDVAADLGRAPVQYHARGILYQRQEHFFLLRLRSHLRDPNAPLDEGARLYTQRFAESFDAAAVELSFPSEQSAVLRARAWWHGG